MNSQIKMKYFSKLFLLLFLVFYQCIDKKQEKVLIVGNNKAEDIPLFSLIEGDSIGIGFKNLLPEDEKMNSIFYEYFYNGGGVSVADIDGDNLPELFFTGNLAHNKLYKNLGNFRFKDITKEVGLWDSPSWTTGTTMVDINNDGIQDIYVCRSGKLDEDKRRNLFFVSHKKGNTFSYIEKAKQYGIDDPGFSTQALFFDYDRDNDLDVFILNHNVFIDATYDDLSKIREKRDPYVGDHLYRNDNGKFVDVSLASGIIGNSIGFGLGVSAGDVNNDGWPDVFVANDYSEHDYLYINQGDGTFKESLKSMVDHISNFSMGSDIADINNDGWADIITLDMVAEDNYGIKTSMSGMNPKAFNQAVTNGFHYQYMFNTLQLNNGNNHFSDIAQMAGLSNTDWSWAPLIADFDNDGYKDIFITNGLKRDFRNNDYQKYRIKKLEEAEKNNVKDKASLIKELVNLTPMRKKENYLFKNNGDLRFTKMNRKWGINQKTFSNGAAYADLDNDGDLDLIVNNVDESPTIYQNNLPINEQNFLDITFIGPKNNTNGIGSKVIVRYNGEEQVQEYYPTRGYQSSVSCGVHFGLGRANIIDEVLLIWADGRYETIKNVKVNQKIIGYYSNASNNYDFSNIQAKTDKQIFTDCTEDYDIKYCHQENNYDDFEKESLLPHKMSQFGPALCVGDINGDNLDDFYIGGAHTFSGALYVQTEEGTFKKTNKVLWHKEKDYEDLDASFFDADNDGDLDLYVVSGGNEFSKNNSLYEDRLYKNDGKGNFVRDKKVLPRIFNSGSVVKPYDYDNDGDLDLFIGGRLSPSKYPFSTSSTILQNNKGVFTDVTKQIAPELEDLGMVTDAIWSDFDRDGDVDLFIVGEWMPITVFENTNGSYKKQIPKGLENSNGWWFGVAGEDFDRDGDIDFIVGNLGLNYKYKATIDEPFEVYSNDFDNNGSLDIVLGYYNQGNLFPLRGRQCSSNQMPFIKKKFPTYDAFAKANLYDVYDENSLKESLHKKVYTFASSVIYNQGNGEFTIEELPELAQLSSINSILVDDYNKDSINDVIIAGNLYSSEVETTRNDAGYGLLLTVDNKGMFKPQNYVSSGLALYGDVKKMRKIKIKNKYSAVLVAKNNNCLQLIKVN
ncbi:VCBS repeat-containing protein [Sabulilitoribacter arenilitoris]|uniref:VCBS repeat-containing protein n=1 Tax=Wocania arenilitoris TaxID=2044858 RepID=A0AAE3ELH2_9FLAO|nr:VCBS repeat-containing protein [Wocania arenilitoris]MCF7567057.1 VCBS repeat-containing protein [Wocania arenilitoris]